MNSIIEFPPRAQVEVKCLRKKHTGAALYRFYDVCDGRREMNTLLDPVAVVLQVAHLSKLGIDVMVDDETHMLLSGNGGNAA